MLRQCGDKIGLQGGDSDDRCIPQVEQVVYVQSCPVCGVYDLRLCLHRVGRQLRQVENSIIVALLLEYREQKKDGKKTTTAT